MTIKKPAGLSSGNRQLIVGLTFFGLLIFGPIEPYGLVIRIIYLIAIPALASFALSYLSKIWIIDAASNDRIFSTIFGGVAALLVVFAYLSYSSDYHFECTKFINNGDECVGEYVTVEGGDKGTAFMLIMFAGWAAWIGIVKKSKSD